MKFRFIGDPRNNFDGPDSFEKFDHQFLRNKWTEVSDPEIIAKLIGNSHFEHENAEVELHLIEKINAAEPRKRGWPKGKPRKVVTNGEDA